MKKMFLLLFFVVVLIGVGVNKEVEAVTMNFDPWHVTPRFQYLYDENGALISLEYVISEHYDYFDEKPDMVVQLNQVTYEGGYIKTLDRYELSPEIYNSTITFPNTTAFTPVNPVTESEYIFVGDLEHIEGYDYTVFVNDINISDDFWYVNSSGNYIVLDPALTAPSDSVVIGYVKENSNAYTYEFEYDWSGLYFYADQEVLFYNITYNNWIIGTGAVMYNPQADITELYNVTEEYGLEYGDFLVQDDGLADFSNQIEFTSYLDTDKYWILHYKIDEAMIDQGKYKTIYITDINSNTVEDVFYTDDILYIQGGDTYDHANSFIVIPINGVLGEGLVGTYKDSYNDDYYDVLHNYEEGSYFISMVDQDLSNAYIASASVVWNVAEEKNPFELNVMKEEIELNQLQRGVFYKNSVLISSSYTTTLAKDVDLNESYVDIINSTNYNYAISYYLDELLVVDDCSSIRWYIEPSFLPYSLDPTDYQIELEEEYCVIGETDIGGHIDNLLVYYAFDTEEGGWIFSILLLLVINVFMIFFTKAVFIYSFVNMTVILLLSFLGLVPMWLIIGVFILGIVGVKSVISGGVNYE